MRAHRVCHPALRHPPQVHGRAPVQGKDPGGMRQHRLLAARAGMASRGGICMLQCVLVAVRPPVHPLCWQRSSGRLCGEQLD